MASPRLNLRYKTHAPGVTWDTSQPLQPGGISDLGLAAALAAFGTSR
jgi:hypothetical protein